MTSRILVLNVGSSSVRYRLVEPVSGESRVDGHLQDIGGDGPADHDAALRQMLHDVATRAPDVGREPPAAIGHRVVHGGPRFHEPVLIDDEVIAGIEALEPLAPLHNPGSLAGIAATRRAFPDVPQVAVFDTAFHASLPPWAYTYAVPRPWREHHQVRRYGFHGTSFAHVGSRAAVLLGLPQSEANLILLHLGNGASACAVRSGLSIDTSMGLTPLEGLVMGTRSGDVDPALGAYLSRVAEISAAGDADADLAFRIMAYRVQKYIGAYAVVLGRVDAIVFTGGIGENSAELRAEVLGGLGVLGVELDEEANKFESERERRVTSARSRVPAYVVPANEELEIARACLTLLRSAPTP